MSKQKQFTERQLAALEELGQGHTHKAAAEVAGVSVMTIYRWLQSKHFQKALEEEYEHEARRGFIAYLRQHIAELEADIRLTLDENTPPEQKIEAAKRLLLCKPLPGDDARSRLLERAATE